jgi:hypothetical protein
MASQIRAGGEIDRSNERLPRRSGIGLGRLLFEHGDFAGDEWRNHRIEWSREVGKRREIGSVCTAGSGLSQHEQVLLAANVLGVQAVFQSVIARRHDDARPILQALAEPLSVGPVLVGMIGEDLLGELHVAQPLRNVLDDP